MSGKAPAAAAAPAKSAAPKADNNSTPAADGGDGGDKNDKKNAKLSEVEQQVNATKATLQKTIEATIKRGDDISSLEAKSDVLQQNAAKFKDVSHAVKMEFCKRHYRTIAIVTVAIALIAVVIYLIAR